LDEIRIANDHFSDKDALVREVVALQASLPPADHRARRIMQRSGGPDPFRRIGINDSLLGPVGTWATGRRVRRTCYARGGSVIPALTREDSPRKRHTYAAGHKIMVDGVTRRLHLTG